MKRDDITTQVDDALGKLAADLAAGKSDSLKRYLDTMARFHRYSFGNCMLIAMQRPDATIVAGFGRWLELKRYVRKGEKGIAILAPCVRKTKVVDKETKEEKDASRVCGFRTTYVFDVSQTEGEPLDFPEFFQSTGEVAADLLERLEDNIRAAGITLADVDTLGGALGVSRGGAIDVLRDLSAVQRFAVLAHEFAHELLHRGDRRKETTKAQRELEAEAVAYVVCQFAGIESGKSSSDYIQLYSGDVEALSASLEYVRKTSHAIIDGLNSTQAEKVSV